MRVLTSKNKAEGRLLQDYNFIDEIPVEMPKKMAQQFNPDLRILDDKMKPTLINSPSKKLVATSRNKPFKPGQSYFTTLIGDVGIGEKLSPGKYKLLQGQPDMRKRNRSHFETFN